jgi:hypothetical protein
MVRFLRSTHVASVALLLAMPGWTTGAGELFRQVVGMASAADTNQLADGIAAAVAGNVPGGALLNDPLYADAMGSIVPEGSGSVLGAAATTAAGNFVSGRAAGSGWGWGVCGKRRASFCH